MAFAAPWAFPVNAPVALELGTLNGLRVELIGITGG